MREAPWFRVKQCRAAGSEASAMQPGDMCEAQHSSGVFSAWRSPKGAAYQPNETRNITAHTTMTLRSHST
jgi:hypothetical protein